MMKARHQAQSYLLLAVIVLMQLVNAFHIHEPQKAVENVVCDMCSHHIHHSGHLISDQYHMHPCLTCQVGGNQYIAPQVLRLAVAQQQVTHLVFPSTISLPVSIIVYRQSRAPPVI